MTEADTAVREVPLPGPEQHDVPRGGRSGFARIQGRQVHYLEWGRRGAPVVLALHGGGQTSYMFEELGQALRETRYVLAPDLPHHGESEALADPEHFGREPIAETLPPLLAEFGIDELSLVGASLGGIVGLTLAARHPGLVQSIVLIDVGHRLEEAGVRRIVDFMLAHESFASLEDAATAISAYLPQRKATTPDKLRRNLRRRPDGRWAWKHDLGRISRQRMDDIEWHDILDGLDADAATVTAPVLVLRGARSDVLSEDGAAEIAEVVPNGRVVEVGGAGHLAAGDNPTSTVSAIREFLDEVAPVH